MLQLRVDSTPESIALRIDSNHSSDAGLVWLSGGVRAIRLEPERGVQ
jgi:hypothetical protein